MSEALKQRLTRMLEDTDLCSGFMYEEDRRYKSEYDYNDQGRITWESVRDILVDEYKEFEDIKVDFVKSYGGENCGSDYWSVVKFTDDTGSVLVKFQGWYSSYHGADYEDWSFVEPKQKTITVYE